MQTCRKYQELFFPCITTIDYVLAIPTNYMTHNQQNPTIRGYIQVWDLEGDPSCYKVIAMFKEYCRSEMYVQYQVYYDVIALYIHSSNNQKHKASIEEI